jgi:hypothetical protein
VDKAEESGEEELWDVFDCEGEEDAMKQHAPEMKSKRIAF